MINIKSTIRSLFKMNLSFMLLVSVLFLSLCVMNSLPITVFGSAITQSENTGINVDLTPASAIRFFDCGVTPKNGTSSFAELTAEDGAEAVLTDRDLDTMVMGQAVFDVSSTENSSIINGPGPDLMVVEMSNAERMNASVFDSDAGKAKWLFVKPTPSATKNTCDYAMNQAFIDLSSFGIAEGSAVPSLRIDNLGEPDTLIGSEIAEIFILDPASNVTRLSSEMTARNSSFFSLWGMWMPHPNNTMR
jgi:hypothetical protein